jgi:hypothetical protein
MSSEGTESDWNFMWNKYLQETVPQEKIKLLYGLANTKHVWLLNRLEFFFYKEQECHFIKEYPSQILNPTRLNIYNKIAQFMMTRYLQRNLNSVHITIPLYVFLTLQYCTPLIC